MRANKHARTQAHCVCMQHTRAHTSAHLPANNCPQAAPNGEHPQVDENGISEGFVEFTAAVSQASVMGGLLAAYVMMASRKLTLLCTHTHTHTHVPNAHAQLTTLEALCGTLRLDELGPLCARRLVPCLTRLTTLTLYRWACVWVGAHWGGCVPKGCACAAGVCS